ncbi:hypothetical protein [Nannocystis pusilla]|uniref:hypothetical protein n=1 Tax=Nannocystis pusilla TaxID=889268 RepID=UPI003B7C0F08
MSGQVGLVGRQRRRAGRDLEVDDAQELPFCTTSFWFGPEITGSEKVPSAAVNALGVSQASLTHSAQ